MLIPRVLAASNKKEFLLSLPVSHHHLFASWGAGALLDPFSGTICDCTRLSPLQTATVHWGIGSRFRLLKNQSNFDPQPSIIECNAYTSPTIQKTPDIRAVDAHNPFVNEKSDLPTDYKCM